MIFDIEGLGIKCQAVLSCNIKEESIVLIRNIHVLFVRANGEARSLIRQYWAFENSKKPTQLVATTEYEKAKGKK